MIYTITLNPAYDIHACMEQFAPYHENLAQIHIGWMQLTHKLLAPQLRWPLHEYSMRAN